MDGVVVVDKPAGMTSHQVVARIRGALKSAGIGRVSRRHGPKVGHAGTLDPAATGVLVVCLGRATRLVPWLQASEKTYDARMRLGVTTDSLDADGVIRTVTDASGVDEERLCEVLRSFVGEIEQVPPMVSAVKVQGERLYTKARRGEEVERKARRVTVHDVVLSDFEPGPKAEAGFLVTCSTGTYVRTLAADIGERLGVGAHLIGLRRLGSGRFTVEDACGLDEIVERIGSAELARVLIPPADAVADYPAVRLDEPTAAAVRNGRPVPATGLPGPVAALAPTGALLAMVQDSDGAARPLAVFPPSEGADSGRGAEDPDHVRGRRSTGGGT